MSDGNHPGQSFRKRRQPVAWAILVVLGRFFVGIPAWRHFTAPPPLNVAGFDRIKIGMTMAEVESLLGGPPGDYGRYSGDGAMSLEQIEWPPGSVR